MNPASAGSSLQQQGEQTRRGILEAAVECAARHGLEGLTIGHLAKETGMSKSGLFAHFGSKEDLQMATIDAAHRIFLKEVIEPTMHLEGGLPRLVSLMEQWLSYLERRVFPCGCFFAQCALEFDTRPGRVHERISTLLHSWLDLMESELRRAKIKRLLKRKSDPGQLAFEIAALMNQVNFHWQMWQEGEAFGRARKGIYDRLRDAATGTGRQVLKEMEKEGAGSSS